jgi:hypothetical protein
LAKISEWSKHSDLGRRRKDVQPPYDCTTYRRRDERKIGALNCHW